MNRRLIFWANGAAALLALLASIGAASLAGRRTSRPAAASVVTAPKAPAPPPPTSVVDAGGFRVEMRPFRRIASGSTVADRLLIDLSEPDRIIALTEFGSLHSPVRHLFVGRSLIRDLDDTESLLAVKADLLLVNNYGDRARVARLRESGIAVFDLGEMRGLATLVSNIRDVAALLGDPVRGAAYERALVQRLTKVAAPLGTTPRRRAIYASIYGDRIYGGTVGTNYHDILTFGGVEDIAAPRFANWPQYGAEDLLTINPELFVTKPGMRRLLCAQPGLDSLKACRAGINAFIELPGALLDDPGPTILEAAEAIFTAAYPASTAK
ncbi:MAG: iron complex transport system substrate-binding protein [Myxococcales bacterium]|nr:iron complex transport system substrate-binding protein [Myxococcales bacterium]